VGSALGVPEEKILALPDYATSPLYGAAERVALEYADAMTLSDREVGDELFDRLRRFYDDDALVELERLDERKARVVCLRMYAGLTGDQIGAALDVSSRTVASPQAFKDMPARRPSVRSLSSAAIVAVSATAGSREMRMAKSYSGSRSRDFSSSWASLSPAIAC